MQKLVVFVFICFSFYACKTEEVYFNVTEPAPVTVPTYIKTVGIINRSLVSDSNGVRKAIDEVLSAKGSKIDEECSKECIRGAKDALIQSNMFQKIVFLDSVNIKNSFPGTFPSPLSWDKVEEICKQNKVDALVALELFHTGTKVNLVAAPVSLIASGASAITGNATVGTTVSTGWRIYDPQNKVILDEYPIADNLSFAGGGINPVDGVAALISHKDAVMQDSYHIGQYYTGRILPYTIRVCREFYIKGNINFKIARRMADAGDWNNAADIWNKETNNPKAKIRARAYYDMAIISELNGNVDAAIEWAKKAYETGGKRMALLYLNVLKDRKAQNDLLKYQTTGQ